MQPIEGRSKRIGTSARALIRNASLDDFVLGVDEFPVPTLAVRQEAIEAVRGLVGQCARSDTGGSATGLSATDAWLRAAAGDVEQRSRVQGSSDSKQASRSATVHNEHVPWYVSFQPRNCGVPLQTLIRLVKEEDGGVFDPEDIAVMATAFDRLLADFKLVNRDDPAVTMLARLVIEIVRTGERDPERIRQEVLGRRHRSS